MSEGELMTLIDTDYDEFVSAFADFAHDFSEDDNE